MEIIGVIPARFASTRLPGKPLLSATGRPLIQHVVEAAQQARSLGRIIVATDDRRIAEAVARFGGEVAMTRADHTTGTDRVAEVAAQLEGARIIVNLQGRRARGLRRRAGSGRRAAGRRPRGAHGHTRDPDPRRGDLSRPVVRQGGLLPRGRALYFSRSPIPCHRDGLPNPASSPHRSPISTWGFTRIGASSCCRSAALPPSPLEAAEKLEQLRVLDAGYPIAVGMVEEPSIGIDTPEDYRRFVERWRANQGRTRLVATELGSPGAL